MCLLGNSQEMEKQAGDRQTKFHLCLLSSILKYFRSDFVDLGKDEVVFSPNSKRFDGMENEEIIL